MLSTHFFVKTIQLNKNQQVAVLMNIFKGNKKKMIFSYNFVTPLWSWCMVAIL